MVVRYSGTRYRGYLVVEMSLLEFYNRYADKQHDGGYIPVIGS